MTTLYRLARPVSVATGSVTAVIISPINAEDREEILRLASTLTEAAKWRLLVAAATGVPHDVVGKFTARDVMAIASRISANEEN